ncbi:MAG TPA: hypothetical protein VNA57_13485 [Acidimicrobiales bacterium]|nr:hypothetical protein [Acidimicrobiales bacterium]
MPSPSVLRAVLVATALASATAAHPSATAQILPIDPTTTTTTRAPVTTVPTTAPTTRAAPATTTTAPATTLAPTTTRPAAGSATTTTTTGPVTTTTLPPPATDIAPGVPDPDAEAPPVSLPPLGRGTGTRVNWAALVSLLGFGIAFAMLVLPGILQRRQQQGRQQQDSAAARKSPGA